MHVMHQLPSPPALEFNGLVDLFLGTRARRVYEAIIFIYMVTALWGYVSVYVACSMQLITHHSC